MAARPEDSSCCSRIRRRRLAARALHRLYKLTLSPIVGRQCRFQPTCSDYGLEAVEVHGWFRGGCLTIKRICRCHPWNPGGVDLVP